jgi:2-desacetyl-2-hydroxyethyl bacteriochlorophyllide A dehydrogenase
MKAAVVTRPGAVLVREVPDPQPGPGDVLIRVASAGVCGTDVHIVTGHHRQVTLPLVPGHEIAGHVESIGEGVHDLKAGQAVAVDPVIACGTCHFCLRGLRNHCVRFGAIGVTRPGGFACHVIVPAANTHPVGEMPLDQAVFAEPLGCIVWGLKRLDPPLASTALLFGAGPIGLLLLQGLLVSGVARVTVVDPVEHRLQIARQLGASLTLTPGPELNETLLDAAPFGYEVVAEATGNPAVVKEMVTYAAPGGKILIFGVSPGDARVPLSPHEIYAKDLSIIGSFSLAGTFPEALTLLASGRIKTSPLVSHRLPLEGVAEFLTRERSDARQDSIKVLIDPGL